MHACNVYKYYTLNQYNAWLIQSLKVAVSELRVLQIPSARQFADIFTKGLPTALFEDFRSSLCVGSTS